jgi:hypothetical protein
MLFGEPPIERLAQRQRNREPLQIQTDIHITAHQLRLDKQSLLTPFDDPRLDVAQRLGEHAHLAFGLASAAHAHPKLATRWGQ